MSRFIHSPNLPEKKLKSIICGTKDMGVLSFFKREHIEVIPIAPNARIDPSVALHADISALHLGKNEIIIDKTQTELAGRLRSSGVEVHTTKNPIAGEYPGDIALNFAVFGCFAIGNFKYADGNLIHLLNGRQQISVNQGYCKCSVLVISESAIITDDESIHKMMLSSGVDSLLVAKGDILLEGHEYGFIGGASFKLSEDTVVFCGDITKHRCHTAIEEFIKKYGCKIISTDDGKLRDIGGIVSITEE